MDEARAKRIAAELKGHNIGAWTILDYLNYGKSAVILKADRDGSLAAVKVFDPDLVERFGRDTQLARVEREKILIGKKHPHLIEVFDGGECTETGFIFIAMAYLPHKNLAEMIERVPREKLFQIISQIASAANFLEELCLVHRDIKPENIAIADDFSYATLLDMSVLRPVGLSEITDENDQKAFIGTLRYSPQELLYRREEDTIEGWRAVNFYQIGAVLHDLIMRYPIFRDFGEPYATLVDAVREVIPEIKATGVDIKLIMLARSCLVKNPENRLSLVSWDNFLRFSPSEDNIEDVIKRIKKRIVIAQVTDSESSVTKGENFKYKKSKEFHHIVDEVKESIRVICVDNTNYLPPHDKIKIVTCNDSKAEILLCFESSNRHNMLVALTLLIRIAYMDLVDNIVYVDYAAFASKICPACIEDGFSKFRNIFKGPYDISLIKENIYELLLRLIDNTQELNAKDIREPYIEVSAF